MSARGIEDAYPLSPLQEGILFHSLSTEQEGMYVTQVEGVLAGPLDAVLFEQAWQRVVDRHPVLRTAFAWKSLERPLQAVGRAVRVPLITEDWSGLPAAERERRWNERLSEDRRRGFDLARAPLLRLLLVREDGEHHRFLWTHHHLILDGWSMARVLSEVLSFYGSLRTGNEPVLPACPPYREHIAWLRRREAGGDEAFWRAELAGLTAPTPLPGCVATPQEARAGNRNEERGSSLPESLAAAVRARARSAGITLGTLVQGAWALLLGSRGGGDDVVFGITVSGRPAALPGVEEMVGLFINTVPLRVRVDPAEGVLRWLRRLQERQAELRQHEHVSLVKVRGWSELTGGAPLFESVLAFENYPVDGLRRAEGEAAELEARDVQVTEKTDFPLGLLTGPDLRLRLSFDPRRIDPVDAERLLAHLASLVAALGEALAAGELRVGDLPRITEAERQQLLVEWTAAAIGEEERRCLHEAVADRAAEMPAAIALDDGRDPWTYAELVARMRRLAGSLRRLGVGAESVVGLCAGRSCELILGMLAVLEAGGAFLPLDPDYPLDRLELMLSDSGTHLVLADERGAARLAGLGDPGVRILSFASAAAEGGSEEGRVGGAAHSDPARPAYLIYTSGSTGRPKGVVVPHRGLANLIQATALLFAAGPGSRVLQFASPSFDAAVWEVTMALPVGATLCLAGPEELLPGPDLDRLLRERRITHTVLPPSALAVMPDEALPALACLVAGGEACPPALADRWSAGRRFFNAYGPTEGTVCVTVDRSESSGRLCIGRPLLGTAVLLLDRESREVGAGVPAELCIGGRLLARGYLGRPDLTAERFVPHPFSAEPGARLYRTGDRARWLADGRVDFLGRIDHQVKIRGFRIEPGEVEAVLAGHPEVREAAVLALPSQTGDLRLVAYVALRMAGGAGTATLRDWLGERLPPHLVPAAFVLLDALPLTPNGKVDRRALPATDAGNEAFDERPEGPVEELLADVWAGLLGRDRVSPHEDFFALGGHSLLATRVASRVRAVFGVDLPVRAVFDAPTVRSLALLVDAALRAGGAAEAPPLVAVPRDRALPLSFAQQRLWLLSRLTPDSAAYNIPARIRLEGDLDVPSLARALGEVARRHESLRTRFQETDAEPVQVIDTPVPALLPVVDLSGLASPFRRAEALRLSVEETALPFDLDRGPLLRVHLLRLGAAEHEAHFTTHHAVSDGWSMGLLTRDLSAFYCAFHQGALVALPELPIQVADFACWQRSWLRGEAMERLVTAWRQRLAGAPARLELPTDHPRPAVARHRGARLSWRLEEGATAALREVCRGARASLFMGLTGVFQALLGRLAGQTDVCLGTPVAGRNHLELEGVVGCFVNTLVLRTDLAGGPGLRALLGRVREVALEAHLHQDLPFEKLVEELRPERDLSHAPLFQVMFALQNAPRGERRLPGITWAALGVDPGSARFDLTLTLTEVGEGLEGALDYDRDLFDPSTALRLLDHFRTLLEGTLANPDKAIDEILLLSAAERHQLLNEWNDTGLARPSGLRLVDLLAAPLARDPGAVALTCGEETLTYGDLHSRAAALAARLREMGVGPESRVGVALDRSFELMVALLAVLRAGAAYVPIDPSHPPARVALVLEDALQGQPVPVLLTRRDLLPDLPPTEGSGRVLFVEETGGIPPVPMPWAEPGLLPEHPAYVIYTSGSTGRPKGVVVSHEAIVNRLLWMQEEYDLTADDRVVQKTPIGFDVSVWELFWPLMTGARLVLARPGGHQDPAYLARLFEEEGITTAHFVPSLLQVFLEEEGAVRCTCLRRVIASGEALPAELVRRFHERLGGVALHNLYGPTEAAVDVTRRPCPRGGARLSVPIGRPIANVQVHVVDRGLLPVPLGAAGELLLGGVALARGYLGRPALTAERFIPDPFAAAPGGRLYRTGDLARFLVDGEVEFLGRIDHQVKVRGFRVEPAEIEAVLRSHPDVRDAVVLPLSGVAGVRLVACLVVREGGAGGESLLGRAFRDWLRERLPEPMVPAAVAAFSVFPLTPNGKLDRSAIARQAEAAAEAGASAPGPSRPLTPSEELLAGLWGELLGLGEVGPDDHFFDRGGHSLLAARLVAAVRRSFGVELPLVRVFERPVLAALAATVDDLLRAEETGEVPPLERVSRDLPLPLSFSQQRLWFFDRWEPGSSAYNIPAGVRLSGELDVEALSRSLDEIVSRHEILRTTYADREGEPVQRVHPAGPVALPWLDLSGLPAAAREGELRRLSREEGARPFDLARGPVLRALLVRSTEREHAALLTIHHIASDAWSTAVLISELEALYGAFAAGLPSPLPELPVQYADFAAWQRSWLQGEVLETQIDWWRERLRGLPSGELPTDRPRPPLQTYRGGHRASSVPPDLLAALRALGRKEGATLFMVVLAGFSALLARRTGGEDVVVGTNVAGRTRAETEGLIGPFLNMLVLRVDTAGDPSFRELVARARATALGAYAHQEVPFDRLVEALRPRRDPSRHPLFQVKLDFQSVPEGGAGLPGLELSRLETGEPPAHADLTVYFAERASRLDVLWEHNVDLFEPGTIDELAWQLEALLRGGAEQPEARLSELAERVSEEERRRLALREQDFRNARRSGLESFRRRAAMAG